MSKFCPTCNAVLEDDASFCTNCGAQFQTAEPAPKKAAPDKAKLIKLGAIAAAAIVVVVILCVVLFANPYKSAIENAYAVEYGNLEKLESIVPPEFWEYYEDTYDRDIDDLIDIREDRYKDNDYEDKYGEKVSVSIDVIKEFSLPKGQVEKIGEYLDEEYDIDAKSVTAVKKVYYDLTIKSDVYASYTKETSTYVVQIAGKWYVISSPSYNAEDDVWSVDFVL